MIFPGPYINLDRLVHVNHPTSPPLSIHSQAWLCYQNNFRRLFCYIGYQETGYLCVARAETYKTFLVHRQGKQGKSFFLFFFSILAATTMSRAEGKKREEESKLEASSWSDVKKDPMQGRQFLTETYRLSVKVSINLFQPPSTTS